MTISSVNSLATNAVTVLTGQKRATVPVEPVAPIKSVRRKLTGNTDDVFKASNAIGTMIGIVSEMNQSNRPATSGDADGIDDDADTATDESFSALPDASPQERGMEVVRRQAAGVGPRAEWARAYLEAQEKRVSD
jgi:hypothetical protein